MDVEQERARLLRPCVYKQYDLAIFSALLILFSLLGLILGLVPTSNSVMTFHVSPLYVFISCVTLVAAAPFNPLFARDAGNSSTTSFRLQNGIKAQQLNAQFATLTASDTCNGESVTCRLNHAY